MSYIDPYAFAGGPVTVAQLPTVPESKGGTNQTTYTKGDLLIASAANTLAKLAVGTALQLLGVTSGAPAWVSLDATRQTLRGVRAVTTTFIHMTSGSYLAVALESETFDTDSYHDNLTNNSRLTVPTGLGGYYLIIANCSWAASGTGTRFAKIMKGGATNIAYTGLPGSATDGMNLCVATVANLAAADYVELYSYQNSGGSLNSNIQSTLEMYLLGQ